MVAVSKQSVAHKLLVIANVLAVLRTDAERQAHAMADPEIQQILSDMTIRQLLQDFQENPQHANMVMQKDATIRAKIEKLIHAGVLQVK